MERDTRLKRKMRNAPGSLSIDDIMIVPRLMSNAVKNMLRMRVAFILVV